LSIVLEANKELLGGLLLRPKRVPLSNLEMNEFLSILEKCEYMKTPSIRNEVTTFKYFRRFGVMDNITKLQGCNNWAFVQENKFPNQGFDSNKKFVFSEMDLGSEIDIVKWMQLGDDLQDAWIMFNYVRQMKEWTTMACHVYDPKFCCVMTIIVCDM